MTDTSTQYLPEGVARTTERTFIDGSFTKDEVAAHRKRFSKNDTDLVTMAEVARMEHTTPASVYCRAKRRGLIRHVGLQSCIRRTDIPKLTQALQPWRSVKR